MAITWKDILFRFFKFFLNPIEKYQIFIRIYSFIMLLVAAYFHGDPFFIKISVIIQSSMNIIINGYNNYKYL